jgi:hypothetical protein
MKACPRCGLPREAIISNDSAGATDGTSEPEKESLAEIRRRAIARAEAESLPAPNVVLFSPKDEVRRFPILTRYQLTLIAVGVGLLIFGLIIGFLLYRQQQRELISKRQAAAASSVPVAAPSATASPEATPLDDAAILEAVKAALTAYNLEGFARYQPEVKDGVVSISGEVDSQPEKDGAENIVRALPGVRAVVNNLIVKLRPMLAAARLNEAEARRLDEAMRKQAAIDDQRRSEIEGRRAGVEAEIEAERRRKEAAAARQREEEERMRRDAEERLKRAAAEYENKLAEQRRLDAERRARAEQARLDTRVLRSGTIAWSGTVDGVAEIVISGGSASVRLVSGEQPREVRSSFSAPVPRSAIGVDLISSQGRGAIDIVQQPSPANGFTTIVRIDDSAKGGAQRYEFALRWKLLSTTP